MAEDTMNTAEDQETADALRKEELLRASASRISAVEDVAINRPKRAPYMQNRELSWLTFNERVLDQATDETVPLLERLNFVNIFWSNLKEFFMVRVGSITDLSLIRENIVDTKSQMTPAEQLDAVYARCHELYPLQEQIYEEVRGLLADHGVHHLRPDDLTEEQRDFVMEYAYDFVIPLLSPQIINANHPFPHLANGELYIVVRLNPPSEDFPGRSDSPEPHKEKRSKGKNVGAKNATIGLIPLPRQCQRIVKLPGKGFQFILLEHVIEMVTAEVFSMYSIKHTNIICVTRNADLDANENLDESDENYRDHMKQILKKRARLAPVRLESERPLSVNVKKILLKRLNLKQQHLFVTKVPLDLDWTWGLGSHLTEKKRKKLGLKPFTPQWPADLSRNRRVMDQVIDHEVLLSYPYESIDPFVQLLREAAVDPSVIFIKITLYRLASQSQIAEALISAAENGKEVTALCELRARFDESNNIEWSQRFEEAGCNVLYGFRDYKVHSKTCCITRQTDEGIQYVTQLGTGNYNEKTAKLYTDISLITTDPAIGHDSAEFFRNMALENTSDNYDELWVAPLQIKPKIIEGIQREAEKARNGQPCGLFFKTNSITDKEIIEALAEASQAGVEITLFVRGISCIVPGVEGFTDNVRVVSIVGRLLEHSRVYGFGTHDDMEIYLSSADLMTRNTEKRVEIAWPIKDDDLRNQIIGYLDLSMRDTAKLRELLPDKTYTPLGYFAEPNEDGSVDLFASQEYLIQLAQKRELAVVEAATARHVEDEELSELEEVPSETAEEEEPDTVVVTLPPKEERAAEKEPPAEVEVEAETVEEIEEDLDEEAAQAEEVAEEEALAEAEKLNEEAQATEMPTDEDTALEEEAEAEIVQEPETIEDFEAAAEDDAIADEIAAELGVEKSVVEEYMAEEEPSTEEEGSPATEGSEEKEGPSSE